MRGSWDQARVDALSDGHQTRPCRGDDQRFTRGSAVVQGEWDHGNPWCLSKPVPEAGFRPLHDAGDIPNNWLSQSQLGSDHHSRYLFLITFVGVMPYEEYIGYLCYDGWLDG
jgi:hypothetical protein